MKKAVRKNAGQDMLGEYDFRKGIRGKYAKQYARGVNVVMLAPDVARVFPDSESVNYALHSLAEIIRQNQRIQHSIRVS